jgi:hypothetical protein
MPIYIEQQESVSKSKSIHHHHHQHGGLKESCNRKKGMGPFCVADAAALVFTRSMELLLDLSPWKPTHDPDSKLPTCTTTAGRFLFSFDLLHLPLLLHFFFFFFFF